MLHGVAQGGLSVAQGGKFGAAFLSASFSAIASHSIGVGGTKKTAGPSFAQHLGRGATAAIVGGTASVIGGGKFANGAVTAAFVYAFNARGGPGKGPGIGHNGGPRLDPRLPPVLARLGPLGAFLAVLWPTPVGNGEMFSISNSKLQQKFKHAGDFGVSGNFNSENAERFRDAIHGHIYNSGTTSVSGTYRGAPVTHYVNPNNGLNVIVNSENTFVSGWRLSKQQLGNVLSRGRL